MSNNNFKKKMGSSTTDPFYAQKEVPKPGFFSRTASWVKGAFTRKKKKKLKPKPKPNCIPYKPTDLQILKMEKRECYEKLQDYDTSFLMIPLNSLKDKLIYLNKKTSNKKTKKKTNNNQPEEPRCDSEKISFAKLNKLFKYSVNVLESALNRMNTLVIPKKDDDDCPEIDGPAIGEPVEANYKNVPIANVNFNPNNKKPVDNLPKATPLAAIALPFGKGGSASNDICGDYVELRGYVKQIIYEIEKIQLSKSEKNAANEKNEKNEMNKKNANENSKHNKCKITDDIFAKLEEARSKFDVIFTKLNSDNRLPHNSTNGTRVARQNGPRN